MRRVSLILVLAGSLPPFLGLTALPAWAAPPNDSESTAIEISSIPFSHEQDTAGADANGPRFCSNNTSVFFVFTPSDTLRLQVDTFGSDYDTVLGVYTRADGVERIRCSDDRLGVASGARFRAQAGVTYYLMVAECCGNGRSGQGGHLVVNVAEVSDEPLEATLEVSSTGTYDPVGGSATISGTMTCSRMAAVEAQGTLRQVRAEIYIARGYPYAGEICQPGDPIAWTAEVESETAYAFGAGDARLTYYAWAGDGFGGWQVLADTEKMTVTLTAP